jgi:hypothetical protein
MGRFLLIVVVKCGREVFVLPHVVSRGTLLRDMLYSKSQRRKAKEF